MRAPMTDGRMRLWTPQGIMPEPLHKRVVRTGRGYAICFTAAEASAFGLEAGDVVDLEVHPARPEIDWTRVGRRAATRPTPTRDDAM